MYTAGSPDPDPNSRGGGQLPYPKEAGQLPDSNECNSTLTSATREEMLTPNPNECNSTLTRGTTVCLLEFGRVSSQ